MPGLDGDQLQRAMLRAVLRPESLLTLDEAAAALPGGMATNLDWLRTHVVPVGQHQGELLVRWEAVLHHLESHTVEPATGSGVEPTGHHAVPVTRWRDAATLLGVSEDTLARRRREGRVEGACYFANVHALRSWWMNLLTPAPKPQQTVRPNRTRRSGVSTEVVDWRALSASLTTRQHQ